MTTPNWNTLVDAATLRSHLSDPDLVIVDCRFELGKPQAGYLAWQTAHLPNAHYLDLEQDLSGPLTTTSGRHPLPDVAALATLFSQLGIDQYTQVVAYDADNGSMAAARLWWLLRWLGHDRVAVLDGGLKAWQVGEHPVRDAPPVTQQRTFLAQPRDWVISADTLRDHLHDKNWLLVDARAPERYAGDIEPLDPVAGHIPGALNHPLARNLDANGRFLSVTELRQRWQSVLRADTTQLVCSCGSGVTACHNLLALEVAGHLGGKLYAGSWSEWCKLPGYPIRTGTEP